MTPPCSYKFCHLFTATGVTLLMMCCKTVTSTPQASTNSSQAFIISEQHAQSNLFNSNILNSVPVGGGQRYTLTSYSIDLNDATIRYANYVLAASGERVTGLLYYEGSDLDEGDDGPATVSYIDTEKQLMSSTDAQIAGVAESFKKVLAHLEDFKDPRAQQIQAAIAKLSVNPALAKYQLAETPEHLTALFTKVVDSTDPPWFDEVFTDYPSRQVFRANIPDSFFKYYELEISRYTKRSTSDRAQYIDLTLRKRTALTAVETTKISLKSFRGRSPGAFAKAFVTMTYYGPRADDRPTQTYLYLREENYATRLKFLTKALAMLDTVQIATDDKLRAFLNAHLFDSQVALYETTVENLIASRVDDLLPDAVKPSNDKADDNETGDGGTESGMKPEVGAPADQSPNPVPNDHATGSSRGR